MTARNIEDLFDNAHSETIAIARNAGLDNGDIYYDYNLGSWVFRSDEDREWWEELNAGWHKADAVYAELEDLVGEEEAKKILDDALESGIMCCDYEDMPRNKIEYLHKEIIQARAIQETNND